MISVPLSKLVYDYLFEKYKHTPLNQLMMCILDEPLFTTLSDKEKIEVMVMFSVTGGWSGDSEHPKQ